MMGYLKRSPKFIVLSGDGINCEKETAEAFKRAGAKADIKHIHELLKDPKILGHYQGMAIPGGFSFGDELGSGQVLAVKLKYGLNEELHRFVEDKKPLLGICNGFQVLLKLGLLPFPRGEKCMGLGSHREGHFINRWVDLEVDHQSVCLWTKGLEKYSFELPIRNAEGRVFLKKGKERDLFESLQKKGQVPLYYKGTTLRDYERMAGVCDPNGLIFGLMPHPEAFVSYGTYRLVHHNPYEKGLGQLIFDNIVHYLEGRE
jgi:phosphoribosylformylglycinamidine synthase